ncbi:MAG: hypothetical protein ACE5PV_12710 [Candidatus Poribacteria bacterium]
MAESVFALPVNLEQIAALIKRMSPDDRQRLLKLVPELRQEAVHTSWTAQQEAIQMRLASLQRNIPAPYRHAMLPQVQRPEYILGL